MARLYPEYIFSLLLVLVLNAITVFLWHEPAVMTWDDSRGFWNVLWQLTLFQAVGGPVLSWLGASWSVSVEWVVNILFFAGSYYCRLPNALLWGMVLGCITSLLPYGNLNLLWIYQFGFNAPIMRGLAGFGIGVLLRRYYGRLPALPRELSMRWSWRCLCLWQRHAVSTGTPLPSIICSCWCFSPR